MSQERQHSCFLSLPVRQSFRTNSLGNAGEAAWMTLLKKKKAALECYPCKVALQLSASLEPTQCVSCIAS